MKLTAPLVPLWYMFSCDDGDDDGDDGDDGDDDGDVLLHASDDGENDGDVLLNNRNYHQGLADLEYSLKKHCHHVGAVVIVIIIILLLRNTMVVSCW